MRKRARLFSRNKTQRVKVREEMQINILWLRKKNGAELSLERAGFELFFLFCSLFPPTLIDQRDEGENMRRFNCPTNSFTTLELDNPSDDDLELLET